MSSIPYPLDPMGSTNRGPYFELVVKPGILASGLTYGFTPHWNAGGYCKVVDWGDGASQDATASGATITHTYTTAGTYTIRIKADCYRIQFGVSQYNTLLYDANGDWDKLGNITSGKDMFIGCTNAQLSLTSLPEGLTNANGMFYGCKKATLPLTSLPAGITSGSNMFQGCSNAQLPITELPSGLTNGQAMFNSCSKAQLPLTSLPPGLKGAATMFYGCYNAQLFITELPSGLTDANYMFSGCYNTQLQLTSLPTGLKHTSGMFSYCKKAVINLDDLTANAPEGGWTGVVTSIENMFYNAGSGNSPGTVTGSRSAFLAKFPNATNTTNAFYGTNTTE